MVIEVDGYPQGINIGSGSDSSILRLAKRLFPSGMSGDIECRWG